MSNVNDLRKITIFYVRLDHNGFYPGNVDTAKLQEETMKITKYFLTFTALLMMNTASYASDYSFSSTNGDSSLCKTARIQKRLKTPKKTSKNKKKKKTVSIRSNVVAKEVCTAEKQAPADNGRIKPPCDKVDIKTIYCLAIYNPVHVIYPDGKCTDYSNECFAKLPAQCGGGKIVKGTCKGSDTRD